MITNWDQVVEVKIGNENAENVGPPGPNKKFQLKKNLTLL